MEPRELLFCFVFAIIKIAALIMLPRTGFLERVSLGQDFCDGARICSALGEKAVEAKPIHTPQ